MSSSVISQANIAVNRFGYGARSDELQNAEQAPKTWIKAQLLPVHFTQTLPHSNDIIIENAKYQKQQKQQITPVKTQQQMDNLLKAKRFPRNVSRKFYIDALEQSIHSSHSVSWRLLDFFSNHFSVSSKGRLMIGLSATLEREAIASNMLGNFEDLLLAVEQHPAMLIYLNNEKSFGPNSKKAKRSKTGLNENLAREILELHTLGVDGTYTQEDVIELAKGITGWSVKNPNKEPSAGFTFRDVGHEPGPRKLLGKMYAQVGIDQGKNMLRDLAMHPDTAKHVCYKLAHHFVSDNPPASLLAKMETTWLKKRGNMTQVMFCLFDAEEAWLDSRQKFKTPREFVISTYRALAPKKISYKALLDSLVSLGQEPFNAGSPAGYSDDIDDWLGGSALMARIDWSTTMLGYSKRVNKVMELALGESVSEQTYQMVMRAESREQALSLLLMSPDFQWR